MSAQDKERVAKVLRLLWGYLWLKTRGVVNAEQYAKKFGVSRVIAYRDKHMINALAGLIQTEFPEVDQAVNTLVPVRDLLCDLPLATTPGVAVSYVTIHASYDHATGVISYIPFDQDSYDANNNKVASINFPGGDLTLGTT
jgi:hypothetical protein